MALVLWPNEELHETYAERHKTRRSATTETVRSLSAGLPGGDTGGDAADAAATTTITLIPDDAGFGLTFGGAKTVAEGEKHGYGIFVAGTKEGSAAAKEPAIVVGLQIVTMCASSRAVSPAAVAKPMPSPSVGDAKRAQ